MLPLCDEIVIAVGKSDDDTLETIKSINNEKIRIIETEWDKSLSKNGQIYAQQTNLALSQCTGDWCIYLQADEVIHENDYAEISKQLITQFENENIDSLLLKYKHFYGSYNYIGVGRQWYKREIRIIRNNPKISSWGDAQGFRIVENEKVFKLRSKEINAYIYHYGWVRPPKAQALKIKNAEKNYYHNQVAEITDIIKQELEFDYANAYELEIYNGTHPKLMQQKILNDKNWTKHFDPTKLKPKPLLHYLTDKIEKFTGYRIGEYKDFILVK